jgi:hypothetical protein
MKVRFSSIPVSGLLKEQVAKTLLPANLDVLTLVTFNARGFTRRMASYNLLQLLHVAISQRRHP